MNAEKIKSNLVWIMVALGIAVSLISILENYLPWLAVLCGVFGSGCRQAAEFTLLRIPIPFWGAAFYVVLAVVNRLAPAWMFRLVMVGAGVEITLVWLMLTRTIACVFCMFNAVVMAVLLVVFVRRRHIWECISLGLIACLVTSVLLNWENPPVNTALPEVSGSSEIARVNGRLITLSDLESGIAGRLYSMREEIYRLKLAQLEKLIMDALAGRPPSEPSPFPAGEENELKTEARRVLVETLQNQPNIDHYLEKPPLPYTRVNLGNSPSTGPADAPVTVIEFSDYLCPACRRAHPVSKEIKRIYQGKVRWVFKDFPLNRHPGADKLAEAARCADEQGKFWDFQDLLFDAPEHPDESMLEQFAQSLQINVPQFKECLETGKVSQDVRNDKQDAYKAGVSATPTFIINGRLHPGSPSLEGFQKMMDEALSRGGP